MAITGIPTKHAAPNTAPHTVASQVRVEGMSIRLSRIHDGDYQRKRELCLETLGKVYWPSGHTEHSASVGTDGALHGSGLDDVRVHTLCRPFLCKSPTRYKRNIRRATDFLLGCHHRLIHGQHPYPSPYNEIIYHPIVRFCPVRPHQHAFPPLPHLTNRGGTGAVSGHCGSMRNYPYRISRRG